MITTCYLSHMSKKILHVFCFSDGIQDYPMVTIPSEDIDVFQEDSTTFTFTDWPVCLSLIIMPGKFTFPFPNGNNTKLLQRVSQTIIMNLTGMFV